MNILILSDNVAPYRMNWAEELAKTNEVTFVYVKEKDDNAVSSWLVKSSKNVQMVKLPARVIKNNAITRNVVKYIKKHRNEADIIIFDGYGTIPNVLGMLYCKRHKIKYFINIDGVRIGHKESWIARLLKKKIFNAYAYYLCGSNYSANWLKGLGIDEKRICVHNFTSLRNADLIQTVPSVEERDAMKKELGLMELPTAIAVGRFVKLKQFDMIIEAFKKYDDKYQLLIIGEGPEKDTYLKIIQENNLKNVRVINFQPLDELRKYYFAANSLVMASNSEVWGMVMNEAMGYGAVSLVASDRCVGAYDLINQDVNGKMFNHLNVDELSDCLGFVLDNYDNKSLNLESLKIIKNYTVENTAKRHLEFFDRFLSGEL